MATKPAFKLDIFWLLKQLDSKYYNIWDTLTEEQRKGFAPLVVMRWLSGTSNPDQLLKLHESANGSIFANGKHPELLMKVLHSSTTKTGNRFSWIGQNNKKKRSSLCTDVVKQYYEMSTREVNMLNPFPDNESILGMAEELGWPKEDIKKLEKEFK